jgi:AcrR family transcriptional regulator
MNISIFYQEGEVNPLTANRSNRRQKQAAATRQDILQAARTLFAANGYAATSMSAIAAEAETAVQTIYDSVGPKHAVILALVDSLEEEAGVGDVRQRLAQTNDPRELIALIVGLSRQFTERGGDIFAAMASAAPSEPDVAEAWRKARRNHQSGARYIAERLSKLGALAPGLTVERAADVLGVLNWGATWQQFVQDHGWSVDECEAWLNETLIALLLTRES